MNEGCSTMLDDESPVLLSEPKEDERRADMWLRSEVEFGCIDSSNKRRRLELYRRMVTNNKRMQCCGICNQCRCAAHFRRMTSNRNRIIILLSLLLKQDLINVLVAKQAYKDRDGIFICHEHFIQAVSR
ncbi:hypothetical protein COOONC_03862 [Cooperia oncophora]